MKNENNIKSFSSGEFARLTGVNKRTLHYYNDIGLFKPIKIGNNGYHYYSESQFASLELILILRKIGVSTKEIKEYLCNSKDESFEKILARKKQLIEESIDQLTTIKTFLNEKTHNIELALQAKHADISIINLSEQKIVLSKPFSNTLQDTETSIALEFSMRLKKLFSLYNSFGTRISINSLNKKDFDCYDRYFAYCPSNTKSYDEIISAGKYIQAFCIGSWDKLPEIYVKILDFAKQHNLELNGYAYEEGLNEMSLSNMGIENIANMDEYITRVVVKINENKFTEKV